VPGSRWQFLLVPWSIPKWLASSSFNLSLLWWCPGPAPSLFSDNLRNYSLLWTLEKTPKLSSQRSPSSWATLNGPFSFISTQSLQCLWMGSGAVVPLLTKETHPSTYQNLALMSLFKFLPLLYLLSGSVPLYPSPTSMSGPLHSTCLWTWLKNCQHHGLFL
jgi:hypothetical protein